MGGEKDSLLRGDRCNEEKEENFGGLRVNFDKFPFSGYSRMFPALILINKRPPFIFFAPSFLRSFLRRVSDAVYKDTKGDRLVLEHLQAATTSSCC